MEAKPTMALSGGRRILLGLTNKRTDRNRSHVNWTATPHLPFWSSNPPRVPKRRNLGCKISRRPLKRTFHGNILFRRYSSLMNSGLPKRLMFRQCGQWIDFCEDIISLVRKDFQLKRTAVVVEQNGRNILLDFLNMIQVDSETGLQRPVAWIDEEGSCFFPEIFHDSDDEFCRDGDHSDNDIILDSNRPKKNRPKPMPMEGSGESNSVVHGFECSATSDIKYSFEVGTGTVKHNVANDSFGTENKLIVEKLLYTGKTTGSNLDCKLVRNLFLDGMGSSMDVNILEMSCINTMSTYGRWELFQKQVEITTKYRGDANVRLAWLPSSKESLSRISIYGMGHCEHQSNLPTHGIGFHLSPVQCSQISARKCDVDEKGVCHLVLCRVIFGNMELVPVGSNQFHPSSETFDSGVDSLKNPRYHTVWNNNSNTHIFPEYIVSFRTSFQGVGTLEMSTQKSNSPASYVDEKVHTKIVVGEAAVSKMRDDDVPCAPKSPWMTFPMLLEVIKGIVPATTFSSVYTSYADFRDKKKDRAEFIKELRMAVGDTILKSIVKRFQLKDPEPKASPNVST